MKTTRNIRTSGYDFNNRIECADVETYPVSSFDTDQRDYAKSITADWTVEFRALQLCKRLNGMLRKHSASKAIRDNKKFLAEFEAIAFEQAGFCPTCHGASKIRSGRIYHRKDIVASIDTLHPSKDDLLALRDALTKVFKSDLDYEKQVVTRKHTSRSYQFNETFQNSLVSPLIRLDYNRETKKFYFKAVRIFADRIEDTFSSEAYFTDKLCICNF